VVRKLRAIHRNTVSDGRGRVSPVSSSPLLSPSRYTHNITPPSIQLSETAGFGSLPKAKASRHRAERRRKDRGGRRPKHWHHASAPSLGTAAVSAPAGGVAGVATRPSTAEFANSLSPLHEDIWVQRRRRKPWSNATKVGSSRRARHTQHGHRGAGKRGHGRKARVRRAVLSPSNLRNSHRAISDLGVDESRMPVLPPASPASLPVISPGGDGKQDGMDRDANRSPVATAPPEDMVGGDRKPSHVEEEEEEDGAAAARAAEAEAEVLNAQTFVGLQTFDRRAAARQRQAKDLEEHRRTSSSGFSRTTHGSSATHSSVATEFMRSLLPRVTGMQDVYELENGVATPEQVNDMLARMPSPRWEDVTRRRPPGEMSPAARLEHDDAAVEPPDARLGQGVSGEPSAPSVPSHHGAQLDAQSDAGGEGSVSLLTMDTGLRQRVFPPWMRERQDFARFFVPPSPVGANDSASPKAARSPVRKSPHRPNTAELR